MSPVSAMPAAIRPRSAAVWASAPGDHRPAVQLPFQPGQRRRVGLGDPRLLGPLRRRRTQPLDAAVGPAQFGRLPPPVGEVGHVVLLELLPRLAVEAGRRALHAGLQQPGTALGGQGVPVEGPGLTPEGEQELVRRVSEAAAVGAEREMARLAQRLELRTELALAVAGLLLAAGGYALGRWDGAGSGAAQAAGVQGAGFVAQVAEMNDIAALRRHCERHAYREQGRLACDLPPVWIRSGPP